MPESRETIRNRMLRTAAKVWDYPGAENESSFDPLVGMLISACAAEIAKIDREKNLTQFRLIEELARLLSPETEVRARPAHAVAATVPLKPTGYVDEEHQFLLRTPPGAPSRPADELYFSPVARFPVARAEIKLLASHQCIYQLIENKYKDIVGYAAPGAFLPGATLYIGMEADQRIEALDELSFFFESGNESKRDFFYGNLENTVWRMNGREIKSKAGYASTVKEAAGLDELLFKKYRTNDRNCRSIIDFYRKQFVTVADTGPLQAARGVLPEAMRQSFGPDILKKLGKDLIWVEVRFPEVVAPELFDDLLCFTNSFPVLNRRQHDLMFRLQQNFNIIPLKSRDYFFDIRQVFDTDGRVYHVHEMGDEREAAEDDLLLRTSGVGRFKSQEASEVLHYLLDTLKDETASYSAIGSDTIAGTVNELNRLIGELEDQVSGMPVRETIFYLMMRNKQANRSLFAEYWSTSGAVANNLKAGTLLDGVKGIDLRQKSAVLVTTTVGGRNRLSDEEKLVSYKRALLSGERLVTAEDIRTFCFGRLGKRIRQVEIRKGVAASQRVNEGLVRTIDVVLTPNEEVYTSPGEWEFLREDMLNKFRSEAAHVFPYRILLTP